MEHKTQQQHSGSFGCFTTIYLYCN